MNNNIKLEMEQYVLEEFKAIKNLEPTDDKYEETKNCSIKNINILVDLLQKEDINNDNSKTNETKLKNEVTKIENDQQVNLKKLENENAVNKEKIGNEYEFNKEKLEIETKKNFDDLRLEEKKLKSADAKNDSDTKLKKQELKMNFERDIELRTDRIIKVLVDGATILVPIIFYNVWMKKGFTFEETGTYTSNTFKNLFSKFKPTK